MPLSSRHHRTSSLHENPTKPSREKNKKQCSSPVGLFQEVTDERLPNVVPPSIRQTPLAPALVESTHTCLLTLQLPLSLEGGPDLNPPDQTGKATKRTSVALFCLVRAHGAVQSLNDGKILPRERHTLGPLVLQRILLLR